MKYLDAKMKKMLLVLGALIVLLIVGALLINVFRNKSLSYNGIEGKLINAAKSYFERNKDLLPIKDNDIVDIDASTLVNDGYMKEISKYQKDKSITCSGSVTVTKTGKYYDYAPYLNCGDEYTTEYLYDKLLENVVTSNDGLYKTSQYLGDTGLEDVYIYRGDYVNNYVKINGNLWRIVKIDSDNNIMLIQNYYKKDISIKSSWDDRYNLEKDRDYGINDYYKSVIRNSINNYYEDSEELSKELKQKIVLKDLCIGVRSKEDTQKDGSIECGTVIKTDYIGLLPAYDYINASLDENCEHITDESCSNYNYLANYDRNYWLLTAGKDHTYFGYSVYNAVDEVRLSGEAFARLTLYVNNSVTYISGIGTLEDPYIIIK